MKFAITAWNKDFAGYFSKYHLSKAEVRRTLKGLDREFVRVHEQVVDGWANSKSPKLWLEQHG